MNHKIRKKDHSSKRFTCIIPKYDTHKSSTHSQANHHVLIVAKVNILHNGSVDANNRVKLFNAHIMSIEINVSRFHKVVQIAWSRKRYLYSTFSNRTVKRRDVVHKRLHSFCLFFMELLLYLRYRGRFWTDPSPTTKFYCTSWYSTNKPAYTSSNLCSTGKRFAVWL